MTLLRPTNCSGGTAHASHLEPVSILQRVREPTDLVLRTAVHSQTGGGGDQCIIATGMVPVPGAHVRFARRHVRGSDMAASPVAPPPPPRRWQGARAPVSVRRQDRNKLGAQLLHGGLHRIRVAGVHHHGLPCQRRRASCGGRGTAFSGFAPWEAASSAHAPVPLLWTKYA